MRIEKVKFNSVDVKHIYFRSFPKNERMPFPIMVAMSKLWNTDFLSFYDKETLCGLIYLAIAKNLAFVMFLAVDESLRSRGYGSTILREVEKKYPDKKIIISIEPCNADALDIDVRKRRKAFYQNNGYTETGYMMKLNGVVQEIIIKNGVFSKNEFLRFFVLYSNGTVWPKIWK